MAESLDRRRSATQSRAPSANSVNPTPSAAESENSRTLRAAIRQGSRDPELITSYTERMFNRYRDKRIQDSLLWESIHYDFANFNEGTWEVIETETWEEIKRTALPQGFWIDNYGKHGTRAAIMHKAVQEDHYEEWTLQQINWAEDHAYPLSPAVRNRKNKLLGRSATPPAQLITPAPITALADQPIVSQAPVTTSMEGQRQSIDDSLSRLQTQNPTPNVIWHPVFRGEKEEGKEERKKKETFYNPQSQPSIGQPAPQPGVGSAAPVTRTQDARRQEENEANQDRWLTGDRSFRENYQQQQTQPPPLGQYGYGANNPVYNSNYENPRPAPIGAYSRELTQLDKIYRDEDKFSGTGDNFNFKLTIFREKCNRVGLHPDGYSQASSIMLSGQALSVYYANRMVITTWDAFVKMMTDTFEGPEWQRLNLTK